MTIKEFRATIEALEAAHVETCNNSNTPHETARHFIRAVGADTAAQCVAAMVRRLHWDGRISRTARQWAEGVSLSEEWERRIDDAYTDRIHAAHLSQIAEAMPTELDFVEAEQDEEPADLDTVDITVLGRAFAFSACHTGRKCVFVHDTTDTNKARDCLIFGVNLPRNAAEAAAILADCGGYYTAELSRTKYMEQVEQADSLDELDSITEAAANDDTLTGAEYEAIHAAALRKAQGWDPQNQREEPAQSEGTEEPATRPMYKTIPEALAIFDSLDLSSVHTITEDVRGETMTGTPAELVQRIIEQDQETNGNVNHGFTTVEGAAIIETAYALSDGEAITTDDGRTVWTGRKR